MNGKNCVSVTDLFSCNLKVECIVMFVNCQVNDHKSMRKSVIPMKEYYYVCEMYEVGRNSPVGWAFWVWPMGRCGIIPN